MKLEYYPKNNWELGTHKGDGVNKQWFLKIGMPKKRHSMHFLNKLISLHWERSTIGDQRSSPFDGKTKHPCADTS